MKELREATGRALPGKSLVVYEPALGVVTDVFPCENGHAQERSLFGAVLDTVGIHLRRDTVIPQWFQASKAAAASDGHAVHC